MSDPHGTLPPTDPWDRPTDPAANRAALERSAGRLGAWLTVFQGAQLLGGLIGALGIFFGGRLVLSSIGVLASLGSPVTLPPATSWLLGLSAVLSLGLALIYVLVSRWAQELIRRLSAWGLGTWVPGAVVPSIKGLGSEALAAPGSVAPDAARLEHLRRTLAGWLTFGQWGTVLGALLNLVFVSVAVLAAERLTGQLGVPGTGSADLGPGALGVQLLSSLVSAAPTVVIVWLILGAIRRWMNLAVQRARGLATGPITPAAQVVGNWFLMTVIVLGLQLVSVVGGLILFAAASVFLRQALGNSMPAALEPVLVELMPLLLGGFLYAALILGLYCVLLLLSRTYALALARQLDLAGPVPLPAVPLAPGPVGDAPNIYRGPSL